MGIGDRIYLTWVFVVHIVFFWHKPQWAVPGLWCMECAMKGLR